MRKAIAGLVLSVISFAGCTNIESGKIYGKVYEPARGSIASEPRIGRHNPLLILRKVRYDERYAFKILTYVDGKEKTREVEVCPAMWSSKNIGDNYSVNGPCECKK